MGSIISSEKMLRVQEQGSRDTLLDKSVEALGNQSQFKLKAVYMKVEG
jgi:hypothetical protein